MLGANVQNTKSLCWPFRLFGKRAVFWKPIIRPGITWLLNKGDLPIGGDRGGTVVKVLCYKVAGSIPDDIIGIFHGHNPSDRTMALGSTQLLTEMSTKSISWG